MPRWIPALVLLALSGQAAADCSLPGGVHINEVRFIDGPSPSHDRSRLNPLVELLNKGATPVAVGGWTLTDEARVVRATLPTVSIPAGAMLIVHFASGTDDFDFADGIGALHTGGDSIAVFGADPGAVALYTGAPGPGSIVDFVGWARSGSVPGGAAFGDAVVADLWPAGEAVLVDADEMLFTLRLLPDGSDRNAPADWNHLGWAASGYGSRIAGPNVAMSSPAHGAGFEPGTVRFTWAQTPRAIGYRLKITTDSTFASGVAFDAVVAATETTLTLPSESYFWRVSPIDSCGEAAAAAAWKLEMFPSIVPGPMRSDGASAFVNDLRQLGVVREFQHKDSRMLCLYNDALNTRPGCKRTLSRPGPWDGPHPETHAVQETTIAGSTGPVTVHRMCSHCATYCARAAVQMINHYMGGNLSQDRISVRFHQELTPTHASPEGDLGHGMGARVVDHQAAQDWALHNEVSQGPLVRDYTLVKDQIDRGYPVLVGLPGHSIVIDGYMEAGALGSGRPGSRMLHIRDPWPGVGNSNGWMIESAMPAWVWWSIERAGAADVSARMEDATVSVDSDGDGIVDFDEGAPDYPADRPRRLHSGHMTSDTDRDDLFDKTDIAVYTFYTCFDNDALDFPDRDGDGMRGEGDCDSDGGPLFDGGENEAADGTCDHTRNPYTAIDDQIHIATDKPLYLVGETVKLTGDFFRADTTYPYGNIPDCPVLVEGQSIPSGGALATNAQGVIPFQTIGTCAGAGTTLTVVDILRNAHYEHASCLNPTICWSCIVPIITNTLDEAGSEDDLTVVRYHPASPVWFRVPDFAHNLTGHFMELNAQSQPAAPVQVGLRLPPFQVPPGQAVFCRFWHAYFSQGFNATLRISSDNGQNWQTVQQWTPASSGIQRFEAIDLTPFVVGRGAGMSSTAGEPVYLLEFLAMGPPMSGGWTLDDIAVGHRPFETVDAPEDPLPTGFRLGTGYPNPFSRSAAFRFEIPQGAGRVTLDVYDISGRRVRRLVDERRAPGRYQVEWDGSNDAGQVAPPGIYLYRLSGKVFSSTQTLVKLR